MQWIDKYSWSDMLSGPFVNGVGLFIGVLGLFLSYVFYKRGKKETSLGSWVNSGTIATVSNPHFKDILQITYKGEVVPQATITSISIWNDGGQIVDSGSLVLKDPLRVELSENARILAAWIWISTREPISASVQANGTSRADINFDFLDAGDGFVVTVLHTGATSNATVKGSVKGAPDGVRAYVVAASMMDTIEFPIQFGLLSLFALYVLVKSHSILFILPLLIIVVIVSWVSINTSQTRRMPLKLLTDMGVSVKLRLRPAKVKN